MEQVYPKPSSKTWWAMIQTQMYSAPMLSCSSLNICVLPSNSALFKCHYILSSWLYSWAALGQSFASFQLILVGLLLLFAFLGQGWLCGPGWLWTHSDPTASAFLVLGLQTGVTTANLKELFCVGFIFILNSPHLHSTAGSNLPVHLLQQLGQLQSLFFWGKPLKFYALDLVCQTSAESSASLCRPQLGVRCLLNV